MNRRLQVLLIGSTLLGSWLGMQAVHESGHVLGAVLTGGRVKRVALDPRTISRTDLAENPRPLAVAWAGPIFGVAVPLTAFALAEWSKRRWAFVARFFAGFCLVANGAYIGFGSLGRVGDCGEMLHHGSQPWQLWLFGAVASVAGLRCWHGLGADFGIGSAPAPIQKEVAYGALVACILLLLNGLFVFSE